MDKIKLVKNNVDIVQVAERYGIELNSRLKAKCPFHQEKTASFSVSKSKQIFHCFGCGEGGDAITLVAKILKVNNFEAAKVINQDFNLGVDFGTEINKKAVLTYNREQKQKAIFQNWKKLTYIKLCKLRHLLKHWKNTEKPFSNKYIYACNNIDIVDYYLDIFIRNDEEELITFKSHNGKW